MTSVTIGFHISGAITAKQNAKEMESILNEAPSIEAECPARCIGELKITVNFYFLFGFLCLTTIFRKIRSDQLTVEMQRCAEKK
jgi:hypothetical protein